MNFQSIYESMLIVIIYVLTIRVTLFQMKSHFKEMKINTNSRFVPLKSLKPNEKSNETECVESVLFKYTN